MVLRVFIWNTTYCFVMFMYTCEVMKLSAQTEENRVFSNPFVTHSINH